MNPEINSEIIEVDFNELKNVEDLLYTDKQLVPAILKFLKYLHPPANLKPSGTSDSETGIGLIKVSTVLQYGGASRYLVFFTKAIHKSMKS